jgi:hypothetical protein
MSIGDGLKGFWLGLRKGPVDVINANSLITGQQQIPVTPGLGNVDVVNTMNLPTSRQIPSKWSTQFMGP